MSEKDTQGQRPIDRRSILRAGLGVTAGIGLAGCADTGSQNADPDEVPEGGTLVWGHNETPQELDVHTSTAESSYRVLASITEPLVGLTTGLEPTNETDARQAGLAADWTISDDGLEYEFQLREGITFHDGSDFTSADVKYTFDRIRNPDTGARHFSILTQISEVETPDDLTVRLILDDPYQPLIRQLTYLQTAIIPEDSAEGFAENPIGTGPFVFENRVQGEEIVLEAYDDYWNEGPYIDTLEHRVLTDPDTRLNTLESGDVNFTNNIPMSQVDRVTSSDSLKTETWNPVSFTFMPMNNTEPPFDDQSFRQAIDFALDKEELVEGALFGFGEPIETPSFPESPFRNDSLSAREQDFEQARSLIDDSAYDIDEFSLEFKVSPNYPWHIDAATLIEDDLNEVGLNVQIQQLQWGEWLDQVIVQQNYQFAMVNWFRGWEPTYYLRNIWHSEGDFNFLGYSSTEFDDRLDSASQAIDDEEAISGYQEAQTVLHEDLPSLQLWFRNGIMGAQENVIDIESVLNPNKSFVHFNRVKIDQ